MHGMLLESRKGESLVTRTVLSRVSLMLYGAVRSGQCKSAYLGYFTQGSAFFTEVNDDAAAAFLCFLDGLFDAEDQIRPARADVGAEDVTSITLGHRLASLGRDHRVTGLTSSCMRNASLFEGSEILVASPKI